MVEETVGKEIFLAWFPTSLETWDGARTPKRRARARLHRRAHQSHSAVLDGTEEGFGNLTLPDNRKGQKTPDVLTRRIGAGRQRRPERTFTLDADPRRKKEGGKLSVARWRWEKASE